MYVLVYPPYSIILYAVVLHLSWAVALLFDTSVVGVTAIHEVTERFPHPLAGSAVLASVAVLAFWGLFLENTLFRVLCMLPQQVILILSAAGAITAVVLAQYSDGVIRSRWFLFADQLPAVLAAIGHTIAICNSAEVPRKWNGRG